MNGGSEAPDEQKMELAAHSSGLLDLPFEEGLRFVERLGIHKVELACAGVFTDLSYGDPDALLESPSAFARWRDAYARHGIEICALSVHGEPLSPNPEVAARYSAQFRRACELAERLGVTRLALQAGLPEAAPGERSPAWIVGLPAEFPFPNPRVVEWQWEERLLPYWREHARIAEDHGCVLCFEMLAWDLVYNPRTMRALRAELGEVAGCNFDPSHLFYQGIDPLEALDALGDAVTLVHAKDTRLDAAAIRRDGWYDLEPRSPLAERPWTFAAVGFGHDALFWRELIARLRRIGYEDVLSIEHEDEYMSFAEGLEKAADFLRPMLLEPRRTDRTYGSAALAYTLGRRD